MMVKPSAVVIELFDVGTLLIRVIGIHPDESAHPLQSTGRGFSCPGEDAGTGRRDVNAFVQQRGTDDAHELALTHPVQHQLPLF